MNDSLVVALNKGRILEDCLQLFAAAGVEPLDDIHSSRKLIFETTVPGVSFVVVRSGDVPVYVDHGAADLGVTGKDTLLEYDGGGFYERLDLGIARCRLMTAGVPDHEPAGGRLRVATKFVRVARQFYAQRGQQVDVIHLSGAMELAPLMGLADRIVDIVETGNTLKANGLEAMETIAEISSRVIVNRASLKVKGATIQGLLERLSNAVRMRAA